MSPEVAVRMRLLEDPAVVDLVAQRFFPGELPPFDQDRPVADQIPCVVYMVMSDVDNGMTQEQEGDEGLERIRLEFDCYALSQPDAREVARAIKRVINGKSWVTEDGDVIELVSFEDGRDIPREAEEDLAPGLPVFRHQVDYFVDFGKVA